jgi:hypothetical protein
MSSPVFVARNLKNSYRVGELEVNALRGIGLEFLVSHVRINPAAHVDCSVAA